MRVYVCLRHIATRHTHMYTHTELNGAQQRNPCYTSLSAPQMAEQTWNNHISKQFSRSGVTHGTKAVHFVRARTLMPCTDPCSICIQTSGQSLVRKFLDTSGHAWTLAVHHAYKLQACHWLGISWTHHAKHGPLQYMHTKYRPVTG